MTVAADATAILAALADYGQFPGDPEAGRYMLDGKELQELTGIPPNRLNDAVDVLEDNGYVEIHKFLGTAPYTFGRVGLNARGRLELERTKAQADDQRPALDVESPPSVVPWPVYPVGSPYGFTDHDWAGVLTDRAARDRLIVCFGLKWSSPMYDTDTLVANVKAMFQTAICQQPAASAITLDFRKLQGSYGSHLFNEIARDIIAADIAVFDTTDQPPNVMIELGVALTWGVAVLPIRATGSPTTPSDISGHTWVQYSNSGAAWNDAEHGMKMAKIVQLALRKKGIR